MTVKKKVKCILYNHVPPVILFYRVCIPVILSQCVTGSHMLLLSSSLSGVMRLCGLRDVRIDPLRFLAGCRKRRLSQDLSLLGLSRGMTKYPTGPHRDPPLSISRNKFLSTLSISCIILKVSIKVTSNSSRS